MFEPNEAFTVTLKVPSSLSVFGTASAGGTIPNDDPSPDAAALSVAALAADKLEGQSGGGTAFTFTVTRSGNTSIAASADWTVSGYHPPAASSRPKPPTLWAGCCPQAP